MMKPVSDRDRSARRAAFRSGLYWLLWRLSALLLALLLLGQLPAEVLATEPGADPAPAAEPAQTVTVSSADEQPLTAGTAVTNTYMLEISTGSVRGGSAAQNIQYFIIYYKDARGIKRSTVIFPQKDGVRKGLNAASAVGNRDSRRTMVTKTFGYTTENLLNYKALQPVSADQLIFSTPVPIRSVEKIQLFGRTQTDSEGKILDTTWSCQSMHICRVDRIYGLEMYGWYSGVPYIDYKGEVIADVVMADGGGIFHWDNKSAGIHTIKGPGETGSGGVTLVNAETAGSYSKPNFVGTMHESQVSNRVIFRIDLADIQGGGFESLAGSYEAGARSTIEDLKFCETAALRVRYQDVYGAIRDITLPVIMNSLGYAMEKLQGTSNGLNMAIAGYAQQGDTLVISAMLPDFKELRWVLSDSTDSKNVELIAGASKAVTAAKLLDENADTTLRPGRISRADQESFAYTCFAAYRDASVVLQLDSACIRCTVNPGPEEPFRYLTASSIDGVEIDAGTINKLPLLDYRENLKLEPADRRELYLVTITTDNVQNAGTTEDILLQFRYVDMRDKETSSSPFNLREYVGAFYGEWPGSSSDFAYQYGFRMGGTVQLLLPLSGVKMFKTVSVKVGPDEWQFKGIRVQKVSSYSPRTLRWKEIDAELDGNGRRLQSHLIIGRDVNAQKTPVFEAGVIYDDEHLAPDPTIEGSGWTPGNLVQDDGEYHEYDGRSREVGSEEAFDWADYRDFMTYEDTLQDLGFTKTRCTYRVTVKVFGNKVNATDDDCGSANLFYFQLLFENGKSGCVLANQQLSADAFRTGAEAEFYIPATQDYGDLTAIRVIPDDQDTNSDIYDKLQIEWIKVEKQGSGTITPTWTADSDSAQGLGWVGIDYRDPGAAGSNRGTEGRTISEIAHTFEITKTSYSTKLLVAISTGEYNSEPRMNANGVYVPANNPILEGGMSMQYSFYDHQGKKRDKGPMDVIHLMNEYSGLEDSRVRTIDGVSETMDFCVSNKNYQFRPGKTDKFIISVDDISKLLSMKLQIKSSVVTYWNIENVAVYLITGEGARYINGNGEYDYKYNEGEGLSLRCCWNRPQSLTKDIQIYRPPSETDDPDDIFSDTGEATVNINFEDNDFPLGDDWVPRISKEPRSKDDVVNLFIYPSTESAATSPNSYGLISEVLYSDTLHQSALRIQSNMTLGQDSAGRPVFYALGLNTNYLDSIAGVEVRTNSVRPVHVPISYAVLQRIRSGVLIDTYYLTGGGNADQGVTLNITTPSPVSGTVQHVLLQVSEDTPLQELIAEESDLAIALYFTTDNPGGGELRTKYIYLTDQHMNAIHPGEVLDLVFSIPNLKEITGVNMVTMGRLQAQFDNGEILEQNSAGAITGKWCLRGGMSPSRTPARYSIAGLVSLLDLDLSTALSEGTINSGTFGPVRMTVGYLDHSGNLMTETYPDLRLYADSGSAFQAGSVDRVRLLIPELSELRWVELEPLSDAGSEIKAAWKPSALSAMVDLSGLQVSKTLDTLILEGEPLRVSLADILLAGTVSVIYDENELGNLTGDYVIPTGGSLDVALNVGEGIRLMPKIQGSKEGVDVTLNRLDPTTGGLGRADLVDTRGYTQALLDSYAQTAEANNCPEEAALWRSLSPDDGTWTVEESYDPAAERYDTESVVFLPPHNYTAATMCFRITLTSRENSAATVYVNLTVPPETNPVDQLLAEARAHDLANQEDHVHTILYTAAVAPTCTEPGHLEYYSCSACYKYFADALGETEILDLQAATYVEPLGHSYGDWTPVAETATHTRTCVRCGVTESGDCKFGSWYSNDNGTHSRTCSVCGRTETAACALLNWAYNGDGTHSRCCRDCGYRDPATEEPCSFTPWSSDDANTHSRICSKCLHEDKQPHSFDDGVVTPPTVNSMGFTTYTCTVCGYHYDADFTDPLPTEPEPEDPTEPVTEPPVPTDSILPTDPEHRKDGDDDA